MMEPASVHRRYAKPPRFEVGMSKSERVELCRKLREHQTSAEGFFWELIRGRRFLGRKFRRQHPLGNFIVDFYCPEARVAIELDGDIHATQRQRDNARDSFLASRGVLVLRILNDDLLRDPLTVLDRVEAALLGTAGGHG